MRREQAAVLQALEHEPAAPGTRGEGDVFRSQPGRRTDVGTVPAGGRPKYDPKAAYNPVTGTLPEAEFQRLLTKWRSKGKGLHIDRSNDWTMPEIAEYAAVSRDEVVDAVKNDPTRAHKLGPAARARISQVLIRIENGLLVKKAGVIRKLTEAESRPLPAVTRRVLLDARGRLIVAHGDPPPQPRPFPEMMKAWLK
jgi:hypothetical protein